MSRITGVIIVASYAKADDHGHRVCEAASVRARAGGLRPDHAGGPGPMPALERSERANALAPPAVVERGAWSAERIEQPGKRGSGFRGGADVLESCLYLLRERLRAE